MLVRVRQEIQALSRSLETGEVVDAELNHKELLERILQLKEHL